MSFAVIRIPTSCTTIVMTRIINCYDGSARKIKLHTFVDIMIVLSRCHTILTILFLCGWGPKMLPKMNEIMKSKDLQCCVTVDSTLTIKKSNNEMAHLQRTNYILLLRCVILSL